MKDKNNVVRVVLISAVFLTIALLFNFSYSKIPDTDSFYHIKHSELYRKEGLLTKDFPWAQYSAINKFSADIWYGFHILIIPLTYFKNLIAGIKFGGFAITFVSLSLAAFAFWRLKVKWPLFWVFIFAFSSADLLFRLTMLRPHPISLGLSLLLFAFLINRKKASDAENKIAIKELLSIAAIGFVFSWIHLALSWVPILIILIINVVRLTQKLKIEWRKIGAVFLGMALGLFLRPNPLGAAKLAYIQVVQLALEKQSEIPLRFGRELTPFHWENFVDQLIPIFVLLAIAVGFLIWLTVKKGGWSLPAELKTSVLSGLVLTFIFVYLTFGVARRSNEIFIGFAVIFISLIFTHYQKVIRVIQSILTAVIAIALIYMPIKTIYRFSTYTANAFEPNKFRELSLWLKENAQPKEVVFNIHWDRFAQLFFWNQNNYYINGMDPIFQYAYDPSLYWKTHFLAIDQATSFTCGEIRCTQEMAKDTYEVLKNDFKASYIVVEKRRNPKLFDYLEKAEGFKKVFESSGDTIFKIL